MSADPQHDLVRVPVELVEALDRIRRMQARELRKSRRAIRIGAVVASINVAGVGAWVGAARGATEIAMSVGAMVFVIAMWGWLYHVERSYAEMMSKPLPTMPWNRRKN